MKALEAGNEDLARRALEDKKEHQGRYDELKRQYDLAKTNADQLRSAIDGNERRIQQNEEQKGFVNCSC